MATAVVASILPAFAATYDDSHLSYTDAPFRDRETDVAVSVLTEADVLRGNPDGTLREDSTLNRAEFMTIVTRLIPSLDLPPLIERAGCFPDIAGNQWYTLAVCTGKWYGWVRGNAVAGVPEQDWRFEPQRAVQYEEAVKVLAKVYALPLVSRPDAQWYVPYLESAARDGLTVPGLVAGDAITRGEMARLTASFYANARGELDLLRAAQSGEAVSSSSASSRSSAMSSSSSQRSSASSQSSAIYDPLTDTSADAQHILLGTVSPILAGVRAFSNTEPIDVTQIEVDFVSTVSSVSQLLIYDETGRQVGIATQQGSSFIANIPIGVLQLPYRDERSFYVRARLKNHNSGGESGEEVKVDDIIIRGTGSWSNGNQAVSSNETFQSFETARARIVSVENAGSTKDVLIGGSDRLIGTFRFTAAESDPSAAARLTQLTFTLDSYGGVVVSNPVLRVQGVPDPFACSISGSEIVCSGIPASYGTMDTTPLTLQVYGDISVPNTNDTMLVRLTLNDPGSIGSAGDIAWTDGTSAFTWLGNLDQPIVRGTEYER